MRCSKTSPAFTALQDVTAQKRDLQRLKHLVDCQDLLYSIADLLHISLPPSRSCAPISCRQAPFFLWDSIGSPSASDSEGLSFEDWLQTVDITNISAMHILGKAISKSPVAFRSAWSNCKHEDCVSTKLTPLCLVLTGHTLSSAQVTSSSPTSRLLKQTCCPDGQTFHCCFADRTWESSPLPVSWGKTFSASLCAFGVAADRRWM
jgi:hypothetical protein